MSKIAVAIPKKIASDIKKAALVMRSIASAMLSIVLTIALRS